MWVHIFEHEQMLAQAKQQASGQPSGQQEQQKVAESIGFKDLPPEGQVQMAAQAGIKLDPQQIQQQQPTGSAVAPGSSPKGQNLRSGTEKRSPVEAASPLKPAMQNSQQPNIQQ